jgi:cysteine desulfurase family protein (TIGR01976 family)
MRPFEPLEIRRSFPALNQKINGTMPVFFDGPGGTQIPETVTQAMTDYMMGGTSNLIKCNFFNVRRTREIVADAREKGRAFFNARASNEIIFGANMSTITAHLSRSISREWQPGDEIIVTNLDHFANISYWKQAAEDRGVKWHAVPIHPEDCTLDYKHFEGLINKKTKFIAFTLASNVCGSLSDAKRIMKMAKSVGAMTYADAVHYAPHYLPDVQDLGCDFMASSPYKFFGPHLGMVYGKAEHLERLRAYKVEVAATEIPGCWETGTPNFEAQAGFGASIEYLSLLGQGKTLREKLETSYARIGAYEQEWSRQFLARAKQDDRVTVWGITDPARVKERTSTFAITVDGFKSQDVSDHLANNHIVTGPGSFYGNGVTDALGLTSKGGVVRVGCVHYNTIGEMEMLFEAIKKL